MKIEDLLNLCIKQHELGLNHLMLKMPVPKSWQYGRYKSRVRTPFGNAKVATINDRGDVLFWIEVPKVEKWIKKTLKEIEDETNRQD